MEDLLSKVEGEPTADRLDFEPELFMGASRSEFLNVVLASLAISFSFSLLLAIGIAIWLGMFVIIFGAIPIAMILTLFLSVNGLRWLEKSKVNKPDGYHQLIMRLRMQRILKYIGKPPLYEEHVGRWGIVRYGNKL